MSIQTIELWHIVDEERGRVYKEAALRAEGLSTEYLHGYVDSYNKHAGPFYRALTYLGLAPVEIYAFSVELKKRECGCADNV